MILKFSHNGEVCDVHVTKINTYYIFSLYIPNNASVKGSWSKKVKFPGTSQQRLAFFKKCKKDLFDNKYEMGRYGAQIS